MSDVKQALIELGCEELPPKSLQKLSDAFVQEVENGLKQAKLSFKTIHTIAAPRRLGMIIDELVTTQPNQTTVRKGPAVNAGLTAAGEPTQALLGFMRSCNIENVAELQREETDKGAWFTATIQQTGKPTQELLVDIINAALKKLPIPKPMRWGNKLNEFVRPVHWVVLLFGNEVVPGTILGVQTGNQSRGHRFMAPEAITISQASEYFEKLKKAYVLADFLQRRDYIAEHVQKVATELKANVDLNSDLLDEVTGIVEWPVPIAVPFSADFLRVPNEALTAAMRDHQKCFSLYDQNQKLLPKFITVSNIESKNVTAVIEGNERVMRARLSDAAFFFDEDQKHDFADHLEKLKTVIFQEKLGSVFDKATRVSNLAGEIAKELNVDVESAKRAGLLCKCDLMSNMVGEFPELQGIMGSYYAKKNEKPEVAAALREYYHPAFAKDKLPADAISDCVALADRLDTLVGIFSIQKPTGEKDPYGLRRSALGVVRILVEKHYTLDLKHLLDKAVLQYQSAIKDQNIATEVHQFILERLKGWYQDAGIPVDAIQAVLARETNNFYDIDRCIAAVQAFRQLPQATALAAANKRVSRLLQKEQITAQKTVNTSILTDAAEQQLAEQVISLREKLRPLCERGEYQTVLFELAELQQPVDRFFDEVMVMADDITVRNNRLALLSELRQLFLRVADISLLQ